LLRGGVRFEQQTSADTAAPAHTISVAMLQKIYRPVKLAGPPVSRYFSPILVD
jgi:hypothetical protein